MVEELSYSFLWKVSIPLWFNSNNIVGKTTGSLSVSCLNSTLVQFKQLRKEFLEDEEDE